MPGVRPVTLVLPLTGPWQAVCGPASALYHQLALWPATVSVAPSWVTSEAVSDASVVKVSTAISLAAAQVELSYAL